MNELAGLFGGGGGGSLSPSSATSQASPFYNTNSGVYFNSDVGATDLGAVTSEAGRPAQGGNNLQNDGATLPGLLSTGSSPTYLLIGGLILAVVGGVYFLFKK